MAEPKLWAVFGPDGKRVSGAYDKKQNAWWSCGGATKFGRRKMRESGYTCREVRIVPVEEVGK